MIQKKICMLGAFAVGKTSLVKRFVESIFSEKYQTTVGVKIDKKALDINGQQVNLILWDIQGEDEAQEIRLSYLRGASGYILVADGTRPVSLDVALAIHEKAKETVGEVAHMLVLNKSDLTDEWKLDDNTVKELTEKGWTVITTSARTGQDVEKAFTVLAQKMLPA